MIRYIMQIAGKFLSFPFQGAVLLLFLTIFSSGASLAAINTGQSINFEQRVACQIILEDIRWSHRIWPKENKTVKPSRPEILSNQQIRSKIEISLRMEAALASIYGIEINNAMLQAELNRMAQNTKAPERLQELFDALGNDPVILAECLARPSLVRKMLYNNYVWDNRYHGVLRAEAEKALTLRDDQDSLSKSGGRENLTVLVRKDSITHREAQPLVIDESADGFQRIELEGNEFDREVARLTRDSEKRNGSPSALDPAVKIALRETETAFVYEKVLNQADDRVEVQTLVWPKIGFNEWWQSQSSAWQNKEWLKGSRATVAGVQLTRPMIAGKTQNIALEGLEKVTADTWAPPPEIPTPRLYHTVIWSGSEMIVWGGSGGAKLNTGGRYDPVLDSWTATSTIGAPDARSGHTAIWSGSEMIIWGGRDKFNSIINTGGRYDPALDIWTPTSTSNTPTARSGHTAIWSGSEMIVWGGGYLNTGGRYDPALDSWAATNTIGAPAGRSDHAAIWSGSEMIVWGGEDSAYYCFNSGGRYDPIHDSWTATSTSGAPTERSDHTAIWSGSEMIVWGGGYLNTGGHYDPVHDSWAATTTTGAPTARSYHSAIWSGSEMIIWGGKSLSTDLNSGSRYDPVLDNWTVMTTTGAPTARWEHTAVWTGSVMIVWGGDIGEGRFYLNTGGRYDPVLDSWTATMTTGAPTGRREHSAIWSGSEMIVWGGDVDYYYYLNTGGCYDPVLDSWTATTTIDAPDGRYGHAIWSGSEMIIWGGYGGTKFNTGGRYDPALDNWIATSTTGAPTARSAHSVIWSGSQMIVWGGHDGSFTNSGGRYDPVLDSWTATTTIDAPIARSGHTVVWSGNEMIVWGGWNGTSLNSGGRYDPIHDSWTDTTSVGVPTARYGHTAIWSGSEMIIWGGLKNTGGRYDPVLDNWGTMTTSGAPTGRWNHTAIWSGSEMVVWGGDDNHGLNFNSGGRYDPVLNSWTATSITGTPTARDSHTSIWSDREMIIWGGRAGGGYSDNNVGIYYVYDTYTVGGSVTGLEAANSLVLQNNGLDNLTIYSDGAFTFATPLSDGSAYSVTVLSQPNTPEQTCSVSNGTGKLSGADVTDVTVSCTSNTYYLVSPSAGANGTISPSTPQVVSHGGTTTFTVTAEEGYTANVGGTCGGILAGDLFTTNAITADCTVEATFTLNTYRVTPSAGANGTISPSTPQIVNHGGTTTFTVIADEGYTADVGGTCGGILVGDLFTTDAIGADCTVEAIFTPNTYIVTPFAGANGTIAPFTPQIISHGSTAIFTVTPENGYSAFIGGTCGGTLVGDIYTTNSITENCSVFAAFSDFNTHAVIATAGQHGAIYPSGIIDVDHGNTVIFTVTADDGYTAYVSGTCGGILVYDTYTTNAITVDCEVKATFTAKNEFPWAMFLPAMIVRP